MTKVTSNNRALSQSGDFQKRCQEAGVPATKRQASKFRLKKGYLYRCEKGLENPPLVAASTKA